MIQMETLLMAKKAKKKKMKRSSPSSSCSSSRKEEAAMKVVYISNPMKFQICASEFRSLVQQLTGQYAADDPSLHYHYSPPPTTTTTASSNSNSNSNSNSSTDTVANNNNNNCVGGEFHRTVGERDDQVEVVQEQQSTDGSSCVVQEESNDVVDEDENYDVFVPEMLENSTLFYSWHYLDMIN
ncbi:Sigma factor binding protein 1, chloroplastic [Linum grandiflorum]